MHYWHPVFRSRSCTDNNKRELKAPITWTPTQFSQLIALSIASHTQVSDCQGTKAEFTSLQDDASCCHNVFVPFCLHDCDIMLLFEAWDWRK